MAFGLDAMFGTRRAAFDGAWPADGFVHHGGDVADLIALPIWRDIPTLVRRARRGVLVMEDGTFTARGASTDEAIEAYGAGRGLYMVDLQDRITELLPFRAAVAADLGFHPQHVSCEVFATTGAGSVPTHYDADLNLNVQLIGKKRWRIAPDPDVVHPLMGYDATARPAEMPADARAFEVSPGSVVFVPRGWWHDTRVDDESVAIAFAVRPPTYATLFLDQLRSHLEADPSWRDYVMGAASDPAPAAARIAELAAGLPPSAATHDRLEASGAPAYRRCGGPPEVELVEGRVELRHRGRVMRLHRRYAPLVAWAVEQEIAFSSAALEADNVEIPASAVSAGLRFLVAKGLLEPT